jgi:hypothetical protein
MKTLIEVSKFPNYNFSHLIWSENSFKEITTIFDEKGIIPSDYDSCIIRIICDNIKFNRITFFCEGHNIVVQEFPIDLRIIDRLLAIFEFKLEDSARETIIDSDESSHILISIFK